MVRDHRAAKPPRGASLARSNMTYFINPHAGARRNQPAAYRVVVRIGSGHGNPPPICFFSEAVRNMRADETERVLILAEDDTWDLASQIVASLRSKDDTSKDWFNSSTALAVRFADETERLKALRGALRLATRIVWSDPAKAVSLAPPREPFEIVWTWCPGRRRDANDEQSCPRLPLSVSDFHVQARGRMARHDGSQLLHNSESPSSAASSEGGVRRCGRLLSVRSTWTWSQWHDLASLLPSAEFARRRDNFSRGEWMLENVCLGYSGAQPTKGSQRWNILAQAHGPSRQLLWPLPWPDLYAEYIPGWLRLDSETADHWLTNMVNMSETAPHAPLRRCTWHDDATAGFLTEITMDNLYHALVHAVPTREFFLRVRDGFEAGHAIHTIPHYTQYWPKNFTRSVGWQILMRSLGVSATAFPSVAAHAQELTAFGNCNCYRRMYGGHDRWMPPPYMKQYWRVSDFRSALSASVGRLPAQRRVLFQLRRNGVRQMINAEEVVARVHADPVVGSLVQFVVMEDHPVMKQYELISTSRALVGMHGMGLAWSMLLASDAGGRASCLEILGTWAKFNRLDYLSMSRANGVHYLQVRMPNAPECVHCHRCSYRTCGNVTANITTLVDKLRYMVTLWDPQTKSPI